MFLRWKGVRVEQYKCASCHRTVNAINFMLGMFHLHFKNNQKPAKHRDPWNE